jgi:tetratricopeptide (TPR) repeat protein/tRNA A-37 threonylcarbamoyl transferase component Bud32
MSDQRPFGAEDQREAETRASARKDVKRSGAEPDSGARAFESVTLETPAASGPFAATPPADAFPGYKVLREIHRGGQGVVYQAIQQATRRKVAIKVMKEGPLATTADRARFEREVHILGQLNHPSIVAIHESGVASGNDYFVMDYISGQPLDEYVRTNPRPLSQTLALFVKVCDAVNFAHLRGIIHRDLKPSNIRVDAEGQPHVLDFGLAKTLIGDTESSVMTLTGQFMGSLPWASPEQAEAIPSKIDLRTDVYSLGVILYQMLTNCFPYEVSGSIRDVLERIIRTQPLRPSTIRKQVNDEVETIVLKCLAKERDRRYQAAGELARDIRHYLAGEPIEAKRDSAWYILSKTMRRHRVPAVCGLVLAVALVGFSVAMTFMWQHAKKETHKAELVAGFLDRIVTSIDPDVDAELLQGDAERPLNKAMRETADAAAQRIGDLDDEPEVQARVRQSLGRLYINLGQYAEADKHLRAAVAARRAVYGNQDPRTAESLNDHAWALKERAMYHEAEQEYTDALAIRRGLFDGDQDLSVAETLNGLGQLYYVQGRYADAEPLLVSALNLRRRLLAPERDVASSIANLGSLYRDAGRLAKAEPLLREALAMRQKLFGDKHFHTVVSKNKLGLLLREKGDVGEARVLLEAALQDRIAVLGEHHPHVAVSLNNLGLVLLDEGLYAEAIARFEEALRLWRETPDTNHPNVGRCLTNLATALHGLGDHEADVARCQEALDILQADSERRGAALGLLGRLYLEHGDAVAAEPPLQAALEMLQRTSGPRHRRTLEVARDLVRLYAAWDQPAEADRYRAMLPDDDPLRAAAPPSESER